MRSAADDAADGPASKAGAGQEARVEASFAQGVQVGGGNFMVNQFLAAVPTTSWPVLVGRCPLRADAFQNRTELRAAVDDGFSDVVG